MQLEELVIPIKADKSGFTSGMNNVTKMITDFAKLAAVAVAAAAVVVGKFLIDSTKLASDLAETVSKVSIVFGDSAGEIMDWAKTSATAMGMSKNSALAAAATYGNLFRAMGITEKASAKMSKELVILAGDLASFNNMKPEEVLDKLRAGLSGETEPLRTLGVNLNQALIEERALELGLWDGVDAIDAAAKAQASYSLILEQTTLAQGDFARTADGLANQQRILAAQWEDMKTTLGTAFLPIFTKVVSKFNEFLKILGDPEGVDIGKIAAWADTTIGVFIKGLGDSVNNWVSGGGPEALTETLVSWIEGIGDSEATKTKTQIAMEHLVLAIGNALREVDWSSIATTMGDKIRELFAANQPVGENSVRDFWNGLEVTGTDAVRDFLNKQEVTLTDGLRVRMPGIFLAGGTAAVGNLLLGLNPALGMVSNILADLKEGTDSKLREIAKTFFSRAAAWAQQMTQGFVGSQGGLFSTISSMVSTINGLLKKIITSFHLSITYGAPTQSGSLGGGNKPPKPSNPGGSGGGGNQNTPFASGGSFVVPSQYGYEGFGMGGIATASAGELVTISPRGQQPQTVVNIDEGRLARTIVTALMQAGYSG